MQTSVTNRFIFHPIPIQITVDKRIESRTQTHIRTCTTVQSTLNRNYLELYALHVRIFSSRMSNFLPSTHTHTRTHRNTPTFANVKFQAKLSEMNRTKCGKFHVNQK